jgi:hypothetical protein
VELQTFEVGFKLPYFRAVCIHRIFLYVAYLVDLVDDDLGVILGYKLLDP